MKKSDIKITTPKETVLPIIIENGRKNKRDKKIRFIIFVFIKLFNFEEKFYQLN